MKICFITEHFPPHIGGVEIVFAEYAKRLAQRGHQVRVVTSNSGGIIGVKNEGGFETHYLDCKSFFGHPLIPQDEANRHAAWADIIHTTTYTAAMPALKAAKKFKKPCILMVHEILEKKWFQVEKNPLKALGFLFFEWFVVKKDYTFWQVISQATKKDLLKYNVPEKKIQLIYHGIDYSLWNPQVQEKSLTKLFDLEDACKIFLYNGRPGQTKGIFLLLEAIKKIRNDLPENFKFGFILSQKPVAGKKRFEKLVSEYGLENLVRAAAIPAYLDLPPYRKNAFAFIVPSLTEGFGFSAAETCTLGVPIISSNAGSLPEVVSGKVLFFENGNVDDLAEKILLATKNQFDTIPQKKFDWEEAINKAEAIYKELA